MVVTHYIYIVPALAVLKQSQYYQALDTTHDTMFRIFKISYSLWSLLWFGSLRYTPAYYEDESLNDRD